MRVELPVRWYPTVTPEDIECVEPNLSHREAIWPLAPEQTALVLIDCWDTHPIDTHRDNSARIIREVIRPVIDACHRAGIVVVHAPSPAQAKLYPQWVRYAGDRELGYAPGETVVDPQWPPAEFRARAGEYAVFERPHYLRPVDRYTEPRRILADIEPDDNEFVIATGDQLHRLCRHRGILHLLFAGFAANMCVLFRDYGISFMSRRGYNCILLRDATVAIEAAHTYENRGLTEAAILAVEMMFGVSSTAAQLLQAIG